LLVFYQAGYSVLGVDNNQRAVFFGPEGDTSWSLRRLERTVPGYQYHEIDIRDREGMLRLAQSERPAVIVHSAARPSHESRMARTVPTMFLG
jgi:CDP-paratose 2-epimerase